MERNLFWKLDVILFYLLVGSAFFAFAADVPQTLGMSEILVAAAENRGSVLDLPPEMPSLCLSGGLSTP